MLSALSPSDHALLDAYLRHGLSRDHLTQAISNAELSTLDIARWLQSPHIAAAISTIRSLALEAASLRRATARFNAITSLDHLCTASSDETTRRLAATTLLRPSRPIRAESRNAVDQVTDHQPQADSEPTLDSLREEEAEASDVPREPTEAGRWPLQNAEDCSPLPQGEAQGALAPSAPSQQPTPTYPTILDLIDALDQAEANDPEDPSESEEDREERDLLRRNAAIEAHLGVPLLHPELVTAISECRLQDLDEIAARIRARPPPEVVAVCT